MSDPTKPHMTVDEAKKLLAEIARNGEGAEKFRALKMVMAEEASDASLPEPLSDAEVIDRLARLIRAAGPSASMFAYRKAFPASKKGINATSPKVTPEDILPGIDRAKLPPSLKQLYKMFPEIKRGGFPPGYPLRGGLAMQKEWCQKKSFEILMSKEQRRIDDLAPEAAGEPSEQ